MSYIVGTHIPYLKNNFFYTKRSETHKKSELTQHSLSIFHDFQGKLKKRDFLKNGPKTDFNFFGMLLALSHTVRNHHPFGWSQKINLNFVQDQCGWGGGTVGW